MAHDVKHPDPPATPETVRHDRHAEDAYVRFVEVALVGPVTALARSRMYFPETAAPTR